jgi:hypothetical protein
MKWPIFFFPLLLFAQDMDPPQEQNPDPGQTPDVTSGTEYDNALAEHQQFITNYCGTKQIALNNDDCSFQTILKASQNSTANRTIEFPATTPSLNQELKIVEIDGDNIKLEWAEDVGGVGSPSSTTDNGVVLWDGTDGSSVKNSNVTINASNEIFASSFIYTSDKKLKKDIEDIRDPLNIIQKIKGVKFRWKKGNNPSYGFLAQDIEQDIPQLVATAKLVDENIKGVKYGEIIAILVEAIKAQQKQIEELKKK